MTNNYPTVADIEQAKKDMDDINTFVVSSDENFTDNTGQSRQTLEGLKVSVLQATGYVVAGTFTSGCTLTAYNQIVSDGVNYWRWGGALPKTVTAGSTPTPSAINAWTITSDSGFKNSLGDSSSTELIAGFQAKQLRMMPSIKNLVPVAGVSMAVKGFYNGFVVGGGEFYYEPSKPWLEHNGGTVIASGALDAWDGTLNNLATFLNFSSVGFGCYVRRTESQKLYPEWFGALGNAVADCTLPIKKAIATLVNNTFGQDGDPTGEIGFNFGVYRVTESGVLTQTSDNKRGGVTFSGAGPYNTIVWLDPSAITGDGWFYNNGTTPRTWNCTFKQMGFSGGNTWRNLDVDYSNFNSKIKGFKFQGPDWECGHVFDNCLFTWLETIVEAAGTNDADTIRFSKCTAVKCKTAVLISNPQSMSISWSQCYLTNHFGDFVKWNTGVLGAGDVSFTDGAIIFTPDDFGGGTTYIFNMQNGAPTAGNAAVSFKGRFELRGVGSRIGIIGNAVGSPIVTFNTSSFLNTTSTARKLLSVGDYADVSFKNSSFMTANGSCEFEIISTGRRAKQGAIRFYECFLDDIEKFNFTFPNGKGYVEISDSWDKLPEYADSSLVKAINGIYSGSDLNSNLGSRPSKEYRVNPLNSNYLPFRLQNECALMLPAGTILTRIYIVLPANSTSAEAVNYRLFIGNNAKTVVYAQSTVGLQTAGFVIDAVIAVKLGTTQADRTVRLWADDGAGGAGFAGVVQPLICNIYYQ